MLQEPVGSTKVWTFAAAPLLQARITLCHESQSPQQVKSQSDHRESDNRVTDNDFTELERHPRKITKEMATLKNSGSKGLENETKRHRRKTIKSNSSKNLLEDKIGLAHSLLRWWMPNDKKEHKKQWRNAEYTHIFRNW